MAPKIFVTGGTGYIGGSVLDTIVTNHPEYDVTVLLRKVPEAFSSKYPNVKIVKGDYDSTDLISDTASGADIVVHCGDSDHEPSLNAHIKGLLSRSNPGFLIHLSGTGIIADHFEDTYLGTKNPKIWSDTSSLDEIRSLPDYAFHRNTEKILNSTFAAHGDKIKIAIICPPDIYGKGRGLVKTHSAWVPMFVRETNNLGGRVFYHGEGTNTKSWVHVEDLMRLYLLLIEAAVEGGEGAEWNEKGYYFASTQAHTQYAMAAATGKILVAQGVISNPEPLQISLEQVDALAKGIPWPKIARYFIAANSQSKADRAERLFGYKAQEVGFLDGGLESDIFIELGKS